MFIERPPKIMRRLFPYGEFMLDGTDGKIYLTFDDGPIPESTPWVLDTLDRYGVKATFFMVGDNVRKYPELYQEVLRRGHAVGNHTMHHLRGLFTSTVDYVDDVIHAGVHIGSGLFRPPHGFMRKSQARLLFSRYRIIMFDLVTRDYSSRLSAEDVVGNVKKYVRPGSIVVFHDSLKSIDKNLKALPESLEWLLDQGYRFALID